MHAAGIDPEDIDTGVGDPDRRGAAARERQGDRRHLAEKGGDFVCATAGHHMEAMLAAYGSGAAPRVDRPAGKRILNIDIGGGTTKLALVERPRHRHRGDACRRPAPGGRRAGRIVRLDPAGKYHAAAAGFAWDRGDMAAPARLDAVAEGMADALVAALTARPLPPTSRTSISPSRSPTSAPSTAIMFSGGVGEYVYGREDRDFGDMGRRLGHAMRRRIDAGALPWPLLPAGECIRATALGASEYSVQLSGNTSYISNPGALLPRRNLQVLQPPFVCADDIDPEALAQAIRAPFRRLRRRRRRPRGRAGAALARRAGL